MYELTNISTIKNILGEFGFTFSKSLGQNFLINKAIPEMIAQSCCNNQVGVIEIGPGMGTLTQQLCLLAKKVVSIEIDKTLIPVLSKTMAEFNNFTLINDDVLKVDLKKLINEHFSGMQVVVCANLPYYITTPIIMSLLESKLNIDSITVMVQKEVAKRLTASPGKSDYGAITLAVKYYTEAEILFDVSAGNFMPMPKVDSAVVELKVRKNPPVSVENESLLFEIIKASFSQRRKTLANALSNGFKGKLTKEQVESAIEQAGFLKTIRGETLSIYQFAQLCDIINKIIQ